MLIASRPIVIKAKERAIPDNFTVFTAAAGDQTANPLQEAKHGMFSYFLMKGMEGMLMLIRTIILQQVSYMPISLRMSYSSLVAHRPDLQGDVGKVIVAFD